MTSIAEPYTSSSELPPELWLHIFRLATWVPDILDPNLAMSICTSLSTDEMRREDLKQSLVTKRRLILVCRAWHSLALPFLWETIYIGKPKTLNILYDNLKLSMGNYSCGESYECTPGWWARYVNIFIQQSVNTTTELQILGDIFRYLPNLTIINFGINVGFNETTRSAAFILRSIAETCGTCLQAITWSIPHAIIPEEEDWLEFIAKVPNIRAIRCPKDCYVNSRIAAVDAEASQHPYLKYLSLFTPTLRGELLLDNLPSLRHLTLDGDIDHSALRPLLKKYGSYLETLQLGLIPPPSVYPFISEMCPNISRLDILFPWWGMLKSTFVLPKSVEVLGIRCRRQPFIGTSYNSQFDVFCGLTFGPKFRVIQIMDEMTVRYLCRQQGKEVIEFTERLRMMGLELHDHEGGLLKSGEI